MCFITIHFGENEQFMMNPNCRQRIFMDYIRAKCQYEKNAFIDLMDEYGNLAIVHGVKENCNVRANFEDRLAYVPVMLEKFADPTHGEYKMVKPLLTDWEKLFPLLEKRIKILTGELKRKKSPTGRTLEPRGGRNIDRKASSNKSEAGRSPSIMGRSPSILQTGRNSGTLSGSRKESRVGVKGDSEKKGKAKKK
ncbi:uncharacterized protein CXorf65 homolog [Dreissena polymorpha]|uniref:Uncharacterized protein n=1 Tax=Dreissena polymorpha TaxID=45954 RepID=A0A9D4CH24_DREPO|nr:uncharacterized protein CXorf65 homolog [Dreissena polymorpha]XP_052244874.1 uncharacterized protein CXorf65 homolog [Dreissena polymorpha]XP_052244875.1 uncharacterized protein CXorf65 homolog [Dreissena polymorpha]KAH3724235.1 hypothetical protein DPMN_050049 [Dreissena polymorpha]